MSAVERHKFNGPKDELRLQAKLTFVSSVSFVFKSGPMAVLRVSVLPW